MLDRVERLRFNPNINITNERMEVTHTAIRGFTKYYMPVEYMLKYLKDSSCRKLNKANGELIIDINTFLDDGHMTFGGLIEMSIMIGENDKSKEVGIEKVFEEIKYSEGLSIYTDDEMKILELVRENYCVCDCGKVYNFIKDETRCLKCREV